MSTQGGSKGFQEGIQGFQGADVYSWFPCNASSPLSISNSAKFMRASLRQDSAHVPACKSSIKRAHVWQPVWRAMGFIILGSKELPWFTISGITILSSSCPMGPLHRNSFLDPSSPTKKVIRSLTPLLLTCDLAHHESLKSHPLCWT